jgi:hypothetical protein
MGTTGTVDACTKPLKASGALGTSVVACVVAKCGALCDLKK